MKNKEVIQRVRVLGGLVVAAAAFALFPFDSFADAATDEWSEFFSEFGFSPTGEEGVYSHGQCSVYFWDFGEKIKAFDYQNTAEQISGEGPFPSYALGDDRLKEIVGDGDIQGRFEGLTSDEFRKYITEISKSQKCNPGLSS